MQICNIKINTINTNFNNKKLIAFKGNNGDKSQAENNDDDRYVKVPKKQHTLGKIIAGAFVILAGYDIIKAISDMKKISKSGPKLK